MLYWIDVDIKIGVVSAFGINPFAAWGMECNLAGQYRPYNRVYIKIKVFDGKSILYCKEH